MTEQELQSLPDHIRATVRAVQQQATAARQRANDSAARSIGAVLVVADEQEAETSATRADENPGKGEGATGSENAPRDELAALTPPQGKMTVRRTVSRRLYLEARRTAGGVSRRWWLRIPKTQGRKESRLALGAYPQTSVSKAKAKAAKLLADEAKGKDVAAVRTGRPVSGTSDAFRAQFVQGFCEAAPAYYDHEADCAAPQPWCAPWTWAKLQEWALPGLTPAEQGRAWAQRCAGDLRAIFARGE